MASSASAPSRMVLHRALASVPEGAGSILQLQEEALSSRGSWGAGSRRPHPRQQQQPLCPGREREEGHLDESGAPQLPV